MRQMFLSCLEHKMILPKTECPFVNNMAASECTRLVLLPTSHTQ